MKAFLNIWLALLFGSTLGAPQAALLADGLLDSSTSADETGTLPGAEGLDKNNNSPFDSEDAVHVGQAVLNTPSPPSNELPLEQTTSGTKTTLELRQHDRTPWWPSQWRMVTFRVRHQGPGKADKVILESPDLQALNLSIFTLWPGGSCPGTSSGSSRIRCEWQNVDVGFNRFSDIKLTLNSYDLTQKPTLEIPFTLTTYLNGKVVELTQETVRWERRVPLRYKQTALSLFKQPRAITAAAWPDAETERRRLRQFFKFADFQSTGFYLNPGSPLKVYVHGVQSGGPQPHFLVGTPALVHPTIDSELSPNSLEELPSMGNGEHAVSSKLGGILYIRYTGADPDNLPAVTVTLGDGDAAQPIPFFREEITTDDEWKSMLAHTKVPFAEHSGHRVRITGLAEDAKVWADRGQKQAPLFSLYREILNSHDRISALHIHSQNAIDRPSVLGNMVVQTKRRDNPNAFNYRAAIPRERSDEFYSETKLRNSWMQWHEFGHQRQQTAVWSWGAMQEITVNIYSLATLRRSNGNANRPVREWEEAKKWLAKPAEERNFDKLTGNGFYIGLVMFEQLRVAFGGDSFYHQLHFKARRTPEVRSNEDKKHFFMTYAAQLARVDLTDYFTKWGLAPEERTISEMKKQPKPKEDYTKRPVYGGK